MARFSSVYIQWLRQQQTIKVCRVVQEVLLYSCLFSIVEVWCDPHVLPCIHVCPVASCPDIDMGTRTFSLTAPEVPMSSTDV